MRMLLSQLIACNRIMHDEWRSSHSALQWIKFINATLMQTMRAIFPSNQLLPAYFFNLPGEKFE